MISHTAVHVKMSRCVAEGKDFEVLFVKKFNEAVNLVIKSDAVIRETIINVRKFKY